MGSVSTYAFGGSPGAACTEDRLTGEHHHHYATPGVVGLEFGRPLPVHAQRPEALAAVEAQRRLDEERRREAFATDHGRPRIKPYRGGIPANATKLEALAQRHGFETMIVELADGCRVEGHHPERRVGFRATFTRGRADGASWHEPYRYAIVRDDRPVGVNALTRTGLKGRRPAGVGTTRLALLGSPSGFPITHTELTERIPK